MSLGKKIYFEKKFVEKSETQKIYPKCFLRYLLLLRNKDKGDIVTAFRTFTFSNQIQPPDHSLN
jgi:hypothetical protein